MHHSYKKLVKTAITALTIYFVSAFLPLTLGLGQEAKRISTAEAAKLGVGQNIQFVERLLHDSVAARQILESGNMEAHQLREKALAHLQEAKQAEAQGDAEAATEALHQAKSAMFKGVQLVGKKVVNEKKQDDYQKKRQSLQSLLESHQRIVAEQGSSPATQDVEEFARTNLIKAQALSAKGNYDEALTLTNSAYLSVKLSLISLRDGKTLVRSLNFETPEDEYRYELSRNDTHNMLVNTVLKEKRADPRLGKLMDIPLSQAKKLRTQAEAEAADRNFESAIQTMEQSTRQIIKAIRMAGIFIPG